MIKLLLLWTACLVPAWGFAQVAPADSLRQSPTLEQAPTSSYRYVNATSLTLRSSPTTTAGAAATIAGASRVQLLQERADGWSQIQVAQARGYVKSDYLVETQEAVTADVDWPEIAAAGGETYSSLSPLAASTVAPAHSATIRRVAPKVTTGPKVYVCGNGRTEVYHSTESCAAMRRCTYQTLVMSQREAQASGLRGCMKCD
ncbi:SH3 domain-containing protein [Hymenobacter sp. BT559]|uniref:SH3 domain-containing protein n=1 Tax=Hymenobacter sp. BT559 TaxID=2795729 RepID=UPI00351CB76D